MQNRLVKISKFLSLVLRHKPEEVGLRLDQAGWVPVSELLKACQAHGLTITPEELQEVVERNDKRRFSFSEDGSLIRANQGHSVEIELGYEPLTPPPVLYHGTAEHNLHSIKKIGLVKGKKHHVHLSSDAATAIKVGQRHGKPLVLEVRAGLMHQDGFIFYQSANGVWLTDQVPAKYLSEVTGEEKGRKGEWERGRMGER